MGALDDFALNNSVNDNITDSNTIDYNNYIPNTYPTLQVHNFDILFDKLSEDQKHDIGVPSGYLSDVPYFSFYTPNSFFSKNIIVGYEDN